MLKLIYIIVVVLIVLLSLLLFYYKRYKNPLIVKLSNSDYNLSILTLNELKEAKGRLSKIGKFQEVLKLNSIDEDRYNKTVEFMGLDREKQVEFFANRVDADIGVDREFYNIYLPQNFPIKLRNFLFGFYDNSLSFIERRDKLFLLSCEINQENRNDFDDNISNYEYSKKRTNHYIIPKREEITAYLLSNNPKKILIEILSHHISFQELSPYITSGGVDKPSLFFGRVDIIRNIKDKSHSNYFIVGARQLGKTSILLSLKREYEKVKDIEIYYITLSNENILANMALALGLDSEISLDELIVGVREKEKRVIFLIDEVDKFIKNDKKSNYEVTETLRKLSQEGYISFIMAGFWELYYQITRDNQAPIKNFGELIVLGGLEREACRDMMIEPMKSLGIEWEDGTIDFVIDKCGSRVNLIAIICKELLEKIEGTKIRREHIDMVLEDRRIEDSMKSWEALSGDLLNDTFNRLVVYLTINEESFRLKDVVDKFKSIELNNIFDDINIRVTAKDIENSLTRLEIGYILENRRGNYSYIVPIFKDKLLEQDIEILLESDIDEYQYIYKTKKMVREGRDIDEIVEVTGLEDNSIEELIKDYKMG